LTIAERFDNSDSILGVRLERYHDVDWWKLFLQHPWTVRQNGGLRSQCEIGRQNPSSLADTSESRRINGDTAAALHFGDTGFGCVLNDSIFWIKSSLRQILAQPNLGVTIATIKDVLLGIGAPLCRGAFYFAWDIATHSGIASRCWLAGASHLRE
jgi:hypothetical protein